MTAFRIAIIGCGGYAGAHARRLSACADAQIVALCSRRRESIDGLIERRLSTYEPVPAFYTDPATMFAEQELDAVVIVTPHASHGDLVNQALQAGCHVLVEKPMAISSNEAAALQAQAQQAGLTIMPCYNPPFAPAVQYLREAIADQRFGALRMVQGYLSQDWLRLTAGSWRQDPALGGWGQAGDSGAHLLGGLCWAMGSMPSRIVAEQENRGAAVDIDTALLLRFPGGVIASIAIAGDSAKDGSHTSFIFKDGRIDIDLWRGEWITVDADGDAGDIPEAGGEVDPDRHFIDVCTGKATALVDANLGVDQARLAEAIVESVRLGAAVDLAVEAAQSA